MCGDGGLVELVRHICAIGWYETITPECRLWIGVVNRQVLRTNEVASRMW